MKKERERERRDAATKKTAVREKCVNCLILFFGEIRIIRLACNFIAFNTLTK